MRTKEQPIRRPEPIANATPTARYCVGWPEDDVAAAALAVAVIVADDVEDMVVVKQEVEFRQRKSSHDANLDFCS